MREESVAAHGERQGAGRDAQCSAAAHQEAREVPSKRAHARVPARSFRAGPRDDTSLGYRPAAGDQAVQHHDHGEHEQGVDQSTAHVKHKSAEQPQYEENYRNCPDHR